MLFCMHSWIRDIYRFVCMNHLHQTLNEWYLELPCLYMKDCDCRISGDEQWWPRHIERTHLHKFLRYLGWETSNTASITLTNQLSWPCTWSWVIGEAGWGGAKELPGEATMQRKEWRLPRGKKNNGQSFLAKNCSSLLWPKLKRQDCHCVVEFAAVWCISGSFKIQTC